MRSIAPLFWTGTKVTATRTVPCKNISRIPSHESHQTLQQGIPNQDESSCLVAGLLASGLPARYA